MAIFWLKFGFTGKLFSNILLLMLCSHDVEINTERRVLQENSICYCCSDLLNYSVGSAFSICVLFNKTLS